MAKRLARSINRNIPWSLLVLAPLMAAGCLKNDKERCLGNGGKPLTAADAKAQLSGNTMSGTITATGMQIPYSVFLSPDGRATGVAATDNDRGSWRVTGNGQVCMTWGHWRDGKENCETYFHEGAQYKVFVEQGGLASVAVVKPGNPQNLNLKTDREMAQEKGSIVAIGADEVKSMLTGNTFTGKIKMLNDVSYNAYYDPSGKVAAAVGGSLDDDKGEWSVKDDGVVCLKWHKWNDKREQCGPMYRSGKDLDVFSPAGSLAVVGKMRKGNPEKLTP